ncbi:hypothetical protein HDU76_000378 [Blyttiomyces sp. JEL0837]|nr:hypothetical protein HDU76_000378 [Blyttiomyces sp. JEL0837]
MFQFVAIAERCPSLSYIDRIRVEDPMFFKTTTETNPLADQFKEVRLAYYGIDPMDLTLLAEGLTRFFPRVEALDISFHHSYYDDEDDDPVDIREYLTPSEIMKFLRLLKTNTPRLKYLNLRFCEEMDDEDSEIYCGGRGLTKIYVEPVKRMVEEEGLELMVDFKTYTEDDSKYLP